MCFLFVFIYFITKGKRKTDSRSCRFLCWKHQSAVRPGSKAGISYTPPAATNSS